MEKVLDSYLEKIEKYLKPLPVSERIDIVKEIKSEILELQGVGKNADEIVERLGNPKELAKAYLGDLITKDTSFSRNRVLAIFAYYSLAGLSGLFVIPTLAICAPAFIFVGVVSPILGALKLVDSLLGLDIPYASNIGVAGIESPIIVFVLCVIIGIGLYLIGRGCWKLLVCYIKTVSKTTKSLSL